MPWAYISPPLIHLGGCCIALREGVAYMMSYVSHYRCGRAGMTDCFQPIRTIPTRRLVITPVIQFLGRFGFRTRCGLIILNSPNSRVKKNPPNSKNHHVALTSGLVSNAVIDASPGVS